MSSTVRQLLFVAMIVLVGVGLVAAVIVAIGLWLILIGIGVISNTTDAAVGPIGVIFTLAGACASGLAWAGAVQVTHRLALTPVRAVGSILAVYGGGGAGATLLWSACSQTTSATRAGPALVFGLATVGLVALVLSRPTEFASGAVLGTVLVALTVFWWLNTNTVAAGCPWYQPATPTPIPAPTTTTPIPDS